MIAHLKCHEFVVGLRGPGVDLDRVLQGDHQELDALVLDDLEVDGTLQVADIDPAVAPFDLLLLVRSNAKKKQRLFSAVFRSRKAHREKERTYVGQAISAQNFRLQPRQIVDANAILLARNRHQNVLALEHLHLLEATARDQLIDLVTHTYKTLSVNRNHRLI